MRVRLLRLTSNRETVLEDINVNIVGFHAGKLKRGRHGAGVLGFVNVHPDESTMLSSRRRRKDRVFFALDGSWTNQCACECLLKQTAGDGMRPEIKIL